MRKLLLTLSLALATCILGNCLLQFGATQILDLFGHIYAQQAAWSLRILGLAAFPMILKYHYIAVSRIHSKMARAVLPVAIGSLLELAIAALGARLGGLVGLSLGWVVAVCVEAVFMFPAVYRAAFPAKMKLRLPIKQPMPVNGLRCPQCDAILPAHAYFCGSCGQKLDKNVIVWSIVALLSDIAGVVLPLVAVGLWSLSLHAVDVGRMNDLGLVSVLPISIIIALIILTLSFCFALNRQKQQVPVILLHLLILIFMLYGITTLVEQAPRFAIVYRHAGYTDFIIRTGTVDPSLDAYFNWPGFFILSAFLTRIAGYHDILPYAVWAPVFFNMIYLAPMYVIFTTATTNKRIVWLALWFFCVTNWIAQDYYSPQGLNFFLYLVIIAILLKWFRNPPLIRLGRLSPLVSWVNAWLTAPNPLLTPVQPRQQRVLLACVVVIFAFCVFSHPLTPFFIIASVGALVIFGHCTPRWLTILMIAITAAWLIFMAQTYLVGNISQLLGEVGQVGGSVSANVTGRVLQGSPGHRYISDIRLFMTLCIWALAFAGAVRRLRGGYHDASFVLLAIAPFPLLFVQNYGGEMLLRIYLFTLPPMVFFAACLFYTPPSLWRKAGYGLATATAGLAFHAREERDASTRSKPLWMQVTIVVVCIVLLGAFLFTRYGNERQDYMTYAEIAGVQYLYNIAPRNSLLMAAWDGTPWEAENYEQYDEEVLYDDIPDAVVNRNVDAIVQFIEGGKVDRAYLIITRSQRATAELAGYPPNILDQLARALQKSGKFGLVYSNTDAQIYLFNRGSQHERLEAPRNNNKVEPPAVARRPE